MNKEAGLCMSLVRETAGSVRSVGDSKLMNVFFIAVGTRSLTRSSTILVSLKSTSNGTA
jgi:hypothetical protein